MNGKIMTDILQASYRVYKKLGQFFFHTYSLTCLNKYIFEQVHKLSMKTMVLIFLKY